MRLPKIKKLKIGSSWYDVKYVDDLKNERGKPLFGRIWQTTHLVEIDKNTSYQRKLQALTHESTHGICWEYAIDDEEDLVEPMSNGFYAFIVSNPELIRAILKCAEELKKC